MQPFFFGASGGAAGSGSAAEGVAAVSDWAFLISDIRSRKISVFVLFCASGGPA